MESDIPYKSGAGLSEYERERCRLDLYYPKDGERYATVVWFHAGGLTSGSRAVPDALKQQGIAVVAVDYRLSPRVTAPAYIDDAAAAVAWTLRSIEKYGGARERVFVAGHSAGGYLALMVTLDRRWLRAHGRDADELAGLVSVSGHTITHFTVRAERGIDRRQPLVDELAPLFHVRSAAPPLLLVSGDRELEMLGRYEESAYFCRMMKVAGHGATKLLELDGFDHGQVVEPAFPLLVRFVQEIPRAGGKRD